MKATLQLREGVTLAQALNILVDIAEREERIRNDVHTNKHFVLHKGKMWKIGDGTGKMWEHLCTSRRAQREASVMMGLGK